MSLRKSLSLTRLLIILFSASINIVACDFGQTSSENFNIINTINKIRDLKIFITSKEKNETVFNVLQHSSLGLAEVIYKYKNMSKIFKKELFKLDTNNIYFAKEKTNKVSEEQKVISNITYYFQYYYNNIENNILVPVKIKNDTESLIIKNINRINYKQDIVLDSTVDEVNAKITSDFIKSQLDKNIEKYFEGNLFKLQKIRKTKKKPIVDDDFKKFKRLKVQIIYTYGLIKNLKTNLILNIRYTEQEIAIALNNTVFQVKVNIGTRTEELLENIITKNFIKNNLADINIRNVFDENKFELFSVNRNEFYGQWVNNSDLMKFQKINSVVDYRYNNIFGKIKVIINVKFLITKEQIIEEINKYDIYIIRVAILEEVDIVKKAIINLISRQLPDVVRDFFKPEYLKIHKIIIKDKDNYEKELESKDLIELARLEGIITYSYKDAKKIHQLRVRIFPWVLFTDF